MSMLPWFVVVIVALRWWLGHAGWVKNGGKHRRSTVRKYRSSVWGLGAAKVHKSRKRSRKRSSMKRKPHKARSHR